jgi:hypothetical protein
MEEWSKPEHGNLVLVSELASPKGNENWKCEWDSKAPKSQCGSRRRPHGPPREKLFRYQPSRRSKRNASDLNTRKAATAKRKKDDPKKLTHTDGAPHLPK